jgi:cell division protein FtsB
MCVNGLEGNDKMYNNNKINYRKNTKMKKRKKLIGTLIVFLLLILLSISIYFLYSKYIEVNKSKNDKQTIDNGNSIKKENNDDLVKIENLDSKKADADNSTSKSDDTINKPDDINKDGVVGGNGSTDKSDEKEYVYGEKVPSRESVSDDYFDDAVFIGNSQIEGVSIYSSMKNATVLAGKGIMVDTIFTKEIIKTKNGKRINIIDALGLKKFGKIYIMLGANELGWAYDDEFIKQYGKVIDKMKELQPKAKIYVNAIIPVSKAKTDSDKIYNNKNIERFNKLILNMTKEKQVYYLDSKEALADEEGNLPADSTTDGIHFNSAYYEKWFKYLKTHTVKS